MGKTLVSFCTICTFCTIVACTTTPPPVDNPRQVWCDHNSPRRDATPETPRAEIDEINAHNLRGVRWCGWSP